nr:protein SRG1-like isoform X2 [Coffea arabica]
MAEKNKYGQEPGDVEGYGQAFVKSEEQKLDWADMLYMITQPEDLRKPHLFPKLPLPLRESLQEYSIELKSLALKILNLIAKALGMKHEEIEVLLEEGLQSMRLTYHPPCPQPELVTGLCHHSDPVSLTILLQINDVQCLQIKENEAWVPVLPLPNAFIVNVGDILEPEPCSTLLLFLDLLLQRLKTSSFSHDQGVFKQPESTASYQQLSGTQTLESK